MKGRLLAFDPSMHSTGWAEFIDGNLTDYGVIKVPKKVKGPEAIVNMVRGVIEEVGTGMWPALVATEIQEYHGRNTEAMKVNDLMNLHAVCYSVGLAIPSDKIIFYTPSQWNKGIPKRVTHMRMTDKYHLPPAPKNANDYLDAIGIGDYYLNSVP